jgi:hypothetical protein
MILTTFNWWGPWETHIDNIYNRISFMLRIPKRLSKITNLGLMRIFVLINAFFQIKLGYGVSIKICGDAVSTRTKRKMHGTLITNGFPYKFLSLTRVLVNDAYIHYLLMSLSFCCICYNVMLTSGFWTALTLVYYTILGFCTLSGIPVNTTFRHLELFPSSD